MGQGKVSKYNFAETNKKLSSPMVWGNGVLEERASDVAEEDAPADMVLAAPNWHELAPTTCANEINGRHGTWIWLDAKKNPLQPLDAQTFNKVLGCPGSGAAVEYNMHLAKHILGPVGGDWVLGGMIYTVAAALGYAERTAWVTASEPLWESMKTRFGKMTADDRVEFNSSAPAESLTMTDFSRAQKCLSRAATLRYCRLHLLGGYARPRDSDKSVKDQLDENVNLEQDKFVTRVAEMLNLKMNSVAHRDAFYRLFKAINLLAVALASIHKDYSQYAGVFGEQQEKNPFGLVPVCVPIYTSQDHNGNNIRTSIHPTLVAVDPTCHPRRAGGPVGMRGLLRSFERCFYLNKRGALHFTGTVVDAIALKKELASLLPVSPLLHPGLKALLPPVLATLSATTEFSAARTSAKRIDSVYAGFEAGRLGVKPRVIADIKAMAKNQELAIAATAWGHRFKGLDAKSKGADNLAQTVAGAGGMISAEASKEEVELAFHESMAELAKQEACKVDIGTINMKELCEDIMAKHTIEDITEAAQALARPISKQALSQVQAQGSGLGNIVASGLSFLGLGDNGSSNVVSPEYKIKVAKFAGSVSEFASLSEIDTAMWGDEEEGIDVTAEVHPAVLATLTQNIKHEHLLYFKDQPRMFSDPLLTAIARYSNELVKFRDADKLTTMNYGTSTKGRMADITAAARAAVEQWEAENIADFEKIVAAGEPPRKKARRGAGGATSSGDLGKAGASDDDD